MKQCVREREGSYGFPYKRCTGVCILVFSAGQLMAQKAGEGFSSATSEVVKYFQLGITLMYAIGAVVGIVGAIKVYNKWNSGDQDTGKVAASWFGSCIFLVVVATILKGFFGV